MEIYLKKINHSLVPADDEAANFVFNLSDGETYKADVVKPRNLKFHRKFFALLNYAFDHFDIDVEYKGQKIEKNFDRFREDIQILAGYGEPTYTINGDVRFKSKSISFGSMPESEFEDLYSAVINVILRKILTGYTRADLDSVVENVLRFS